MRILDMDLDFFLSDITCDSNPAERVSDEEVRPWTDKEAITFLNTKLGIGKGASVPLYVVATHDLVFDELYSLHYPLNSRESISSFDIVHVDAHADLGFGDRSVSSVIELLDVKPGDRKLYCPQALRTLDPDQTSLNEGNYLLYAMFHRMVNSISYIHHPNNECGYDVPKRIHPRKNALRLPRIRQEHAGKMIPSDCFPAGYEVEQGDREPDVEFSLIDPDEPISVGPFDRAFLSLSPHFTPKASDELAKTIVNLEGFHLVSAPEGF